MNKKRLYVFNLETNINNPILSFTHDWILNFANQVDKVFVYSTHVGKHKLPKNVEVNEIGGGNFYQKVRALFRLTKSAFAIIRFRKDSIVFHHMSTRTSVFPGILIRLAGVNQGLWYSHSAKPISLRVAARIADVIISSTDGSFPLCSSKIAYVGHGIDLSKSEEILLNAPKSRRGVVSLGRITSVKNLDKLLVSLSKLNTKYDVTFIGPSDKNKVVDKKLMSLAGDAKVNLAINPQISHDEVLGKLAKFSIYYTGTPRSVDKSTIEAASVGCFVVTMEKAAQELTGMKQIWEELDQPENLSIDEQIRELEKLTEYEQVELRKLLHNQSVSKNNVTNTTQKILTIIAGSNI